MRLTSTQSHRNKAKTSSNHAGFLRGKGNKVRARIVAKGFTETVTDLDDIYASAPIHCVLRKILTRACNNGWIGLTGDMSAAFLHAAAATTDLYLYPPKESKGVLQA